MRLRRLWLENYYNLKDFEIEFAPPQWEPGKTGVRLFVGLNGTGKSNTLEAIGLIFSHLAVGTEPGIAFELEYDLGDRTILVTNRPDRVLGFEIHPISGLGVALLVRSVSELQWHQGHIRTEWPSGSESVLPGRVVGYSGGPTSGMREALTEAVTRTVRIRLGDFEAEARPTGMEEEEWDAYLHAKQQDLNERVEAYLDNPTTLFLGAKDALCAVLALMAHNGIDNTADGVEYRRLRAALLKRVSLDSNAPLQAFSLKVSGSWSQALTPKRRALLQNLLRKATVKTPLDRRPEFDDTSGGDPVLPDFYAVFDLDHDMYEKSLGEVSATPYGLFEELLAWTRQGALLDIHLLLKKQRVPSLLPESALSDGEYLFLGRYGVLLMLRDVPEALILLDEPETHYNDQWKAELVKDIRLLLDQQERVDTHSSEVIIATHSAIVLSDVDAAQISIFHAVEGEVVVSPPDTPTFATDISVITGELAGRDTTVGSYAESYVRQQLKQHRNNRAELAKLLAKVGPGPFRLEVLEAIRRLG